LLTHPLKRKKADNQYYPLFVPFTGFNQYPTIAPGFMDAVEVVAEAADADLH